MSDALILGIIGGGVTIIVAVIGLAASVVTNRIRSLEVKVDGRLTEILALTASASHAEGKLEGASEQKSQETQ